MIITDQPEPLLFTKLLGLKATFLSLIGATIVFALTIHYQSIYQTQWQEKLNSITYLLYGVLVITALFSAQFNRSRVTLLCLLWGLFLATNNYALPWSKWLTANNQWLILCGGGLLVLLALIKDRGLISVHGVKRLIFIALCGALAYGWLMLADIVAPMLPKHQITTTLLPLMSLKIPLAIMALLLLWQSLRQSSLTLTTLLTGFIVWCLMHFQVISLSWVAVISVLVIHHLLIVIIDAYFLAYRDDLTGLASRRALNQLALSLGRKYTVAMLDIDHFKKFNDTYGHDIGDQVLKLVAAKLAKVKGGGKVFRYGGEEFTIVFPRKTVEQCLPQLDALRQSIADYGMVVRKPQRKTKQDRKAEPPGEKTVSVQISIGVTSRNGKQQFEQALKEADLALYRAKKKGRNNVSV
jgi:diguanylate cyclase (GGDEF)-like protein